jgi:teichoic acid transport system permease protein
VTTASTQRQAGFDAAALASRWGLERVGARPPLVSYLKDAWRRRHFATELAKSKVIASTAENSLGLLWELLNPLLLAGVYYFAFGLLLGTRKDSDNFIGFLLCGVLSWYLLNRSIRSGSQAVTGNRNLVRSLHFPRIILPISVVLRQMLSFYTNFVIIVAVALITGEGFRWQWILGPIDVILMGIFASGAAMLAAWAVARWRDFGDLLPFLLRMWMYFTGIFFNVHIRYKDAPHFVQLLAYYNPGAIYLQIMRHAFLGSVQVVPLVYVWAVAWAVIFIVLGSVVFWRAEEHYGNA